MMPIRKHQRISIELPAQTASPVSILGACDLLTLREIYPINIRGSGTCQSGP